MVHMTEATSYDDEVQEVKRIAKEFFHDAPFIEIESVERLQGNLANSNRIMVELDCSEYKPDHTGVWDGGALEPFVEEGYIPTSVGSTTAWFHPIGAGITLK